MARPNKKGLDYFPLSMDFFRDEKIVPVTDEYGLKGEAIILRLLGFIYLNGYYIAWDDYAANFVARTYFSGCTHGVSPKLVASVVSKLVDGGFFCADLYHSFRILTSRSIQRVYFNACARRKNIEVVREYLLVNEQEIGSMSNIVYLPCRNNQEHKINVNNNSINVRNNLVNVSNNTQRKVNSSNNTTTGVNVSNNSVNVNNNYGNPFAIQELTEEQEIWLSAIECWQNNIGRLPMGIVEDDLRFYLSKVGIDCFRIACEHTNRQAPDNKQRYVMVVLKHWTEQGICTISAANANIMEHAERIRRSQNWKEENNGQATTKLNFYT